VHGLEWVHAGKQDGHYVGFYGGEMLPTNVDKFHQYLNFQMGLKMFGLNAATLMKTGLCMSWIMQKLLKVYLMHKSSNLWCRQIIWYTLNKKGHKFGSKNYTNDTTVSNEHYSYSNGDCKMDGSIVHNSVYSQPQPTPFWSNLSKFNGAFNVCSHNV